MAENKSDLENYTGTRIYNILKRKKHTTTGKMVLHFPRTYKFYDHESGLWAGNETDQAYACRLISYSSKEKNNQTIVKATVLEHLSGKKLYISWFNQSYMYGILKSSFKPNDMLFICGKAKFLSEYNNFFMLNPNIFKHFESDDLRIYPVYTKYRGISEEKLIDIINYSIHITTISDNLPLELIERYDLPPLAKAINEMHHPTEQMCLHQSSMRIDIEDLFFFALKLEEVNRGMPVGSPFGIKSLKNTKCFITSLPYDLTKDQQRIFETMVASIRYGKRLNCMIEGDVGCGKTMLAFLMMFVMADSGFQSLLFAPTGVLAKQHYNELSSYADRFGYKVVFLSSDLKAKEKRTVLQMIKDGEADMIVGTHSVLNPNIEFSRLGLTIVDEEHKFGVLQRNSISQKSMMGIHSITMSATPIPRSLAETMFADNVQIHRVITMPSGRKPIKTTIYNNQTGIFRFIDQELASGRQAYIVCPLIVANEKSSKDMLPVEDTYRLYKSYYDVSDIQIGILTGKMKPEEMQKAISDFSSGNTRILISTTVVEVGVNVPNASVIVINNAEYFGLAGLHQLRGRVGRGGYQGYCILNSPEKDNERLLALCKYTSGFEIAEEDLRLRGTGNLIGEEQSGDNRFVKLVQEYPDIFKMCKYLAAEYIDDGRSEKFIDAYMQLHG